mmetsp:Transcript_5865/g.14593  ORF Transcript_5865/g.14593 Transcript_5865/m.14593 type:complete len:241 (-) Transcript_5865:230-952(-)
MSRCTCHPCQLPARRQAERQRLVTAPRPAPPRSPPQPQERGVAAARGAARSTHLPACRPSPHAHPRAPHPLHPLPQQGLMPQRARPRAARLPALRRARSLRPATRPCRRPRRSRASCATRALTRSWRRSRRPSGCRGTWGTCRMVVRVRVRARAAARRRVVAPARLRQGMAWLRRVPPLPAPPRHLRPPHPAPAARLLIHKKTSQRQLARRGPMPLWSRGRSRQTGRVRTAHSKGARPHV